MAHVNYKYVFDAKYKVEYKKQDDGVIYERPSENDMNTMHRYRDAIVYKTNEHQYERTVFGAFVLFPGHNQEGYQQDDFYKSIASVGIGGFPFLPSCTRLVGDFLEQLVDESGHEHYKNVSLPQGTKDYIEDCQIEKRNVLVGNVKSLEQLEGIKKHCLYHIPLQQVRGRMLGTRYVALYESKKYGIGGIRYWGKVKQLEIMPRKKLLKQFPSHRANLEEEYVVYTLESIELLDRHITAVHDPVRNRRYTNKTLLHYATTVSELSIKSQEEFDLYLAMKRVTSNYIGVEDDMDSQYRAECNGTIVSIEEGRLIVSKGTEKEYIDLEAFQKNPVGVLRQIL